MTSPSEYTTLIKSRNNLHSVYFVNRYCLPYATILAGFSEFGKVESIEIIDIDDVKGIIVHYCNYESAKRAVKGLKGEKVARLRLHPSSKDEDEIDAINWNGCRRRLLMDLEV